MQKWVVVTGSALLAATVMAVVLMPAKITKEEALLNRCDQALDLVENGLTKVTVEMDAAGSMAEDVVEKREHKLKLLMLDCDYIFEVLDELQLSPERYVWASVCICLYLSVSFYLRSVSPFLFLMPPL